jgi:hypothetical protein
MQGVTHIADGLCDIENIDVTISAAVELDGQSNSKWQIWATHTKTPIRYFGWYTPDLSSLPCNIGRGRSIQEEQIDNTSEDVVFNILSSSGEFDIHTVRIEEEDTTGWSILSGLLVDEDWVSSVEIGSRGCSVCVSGPEGSNITFVLDGKSDISLVHWVYEKNSRKVVIVLS